jgi:hypothetical protein
MLRLYAMELVVAYFEVLFPFVDIKSIPLPPPLPAPPPPAPPTPIVPQPPWGNEI